ncbi:MAG: ABC transporter ATP-binding protein [Alphaproteobacteria bacterium]|nr:ABC transporter ATP-binding protein [Alphaproteobacteria bacterium]
MKAIDVNKLTKIYGSSNTSIVNSKKALDNFSLQVNRASIFGLLGPNGAGKSTLINILAGTVRKTSGAVRIMGVDIDTDPRLAKTKIGVVPQEIALDTFFPLYESLEFYAGYFGIRPEQRRTNEILDALGLLDKANSIPRSLSGGMKRRFLVAKAMVHSPEILILDEPTAGVDLELRDQLWKYVLDLKSKGTTIILTTHYLQEAEHLCDTIGFISDGKLAFCDSKDNMLSTLSQKSMKISISSELKELPRFLLDYNASLLSPHLISIKYNKNTPGVAQVINAISSAGLDITDIAIEETTLEDILRHYYNRA